MPVRFCPLLVEKEKNKRQKGWKKTMNETWKHEKFVSWMVYFRIILETVCQSLFVFLCIRHEDVVAAASPHSVKLSVTSSTRCLSVLSHTNVENHWKMSFLSFPFAESASILLIWALQTLTCLSIAFFQSSFVYCLCCFVVLSYLRWLELCEGSKTQHWKRASISFSSLKEHFKVA